MFIVFDLKFQKYLFPTILQSLVADMKADFIVYRNCDTSKQEMF